jgi:putative ABC transport system permease protein
MAGRVPLIEGTRLDWVVLAFCVGLTLAVCTVCGLMPLVDWRAVDWSARGQSESRSSRRLRHVLVVGEAALAVTVVATTGLLLKTVANLRSVDVGFETARTLIVSTDLTTAPLRARGGAARFVQDVIPRLAALPGVRGAAASTGVPFESGTASQAITRFGDPVRPAAASPQVGQTAVTPGYFGLMGIAITQGRGFTDDDRPDGRLVAVINTTAARRYWPGENPVGQRFAMGSAERFGSFRPVPPGEVEWREIVGVVSDIRSGGFGSEVRPEVYYSYQQYPLFDPALVVRTAGEPAPLMAAIRREIQAASNQAVVTGVRTLERVADESIADPRLRAVLAAIFATLALGLGMLGIYGVTSYTVEQRTREIGIRVALGARRRQIVAMILAQALRLAGLGACIGVAGAYLAARWISSLLFGVSASDPVSIAAACLLLLAVAAVAIVFPTRRALRVDPADALRAE